MERAHLPAALDRDRCRVLNLTGVPAPVYAAALAVGGRTTRLATGPLRVGGTPIFLTLDRLRDLGGRDLRRGFEVAFVVPPRALAGEGDAGTKHSAITDVP